MTSPAEDRTQQAPVCYRHKDRPTNVRCQNCEKPICSDCMRDTPVGFRCPDCAGASSRPVFQDGMVVTKALIGINVLVFVAGIVLALADGATSGMVTGGSGQLNIDGGLIVSASMPSTGELIGVADGEWWRLLTSGFLHGGVLHLGLNMYFIWMFGQLLEPSLHRVRFALVYFAALFGGSIGAMLYSAPNSFTVGASGAAFGLLGASLAIARIRKIQALESSLLTLAAVNFAIGFIPGFNVSVGGHLGGFIVGALCGWLIAGPLARQRVLVTGLLAVLMVALFVGGIGVADLRSLFPD